MPQAHYIKFIQHVNTPKRLQHSLGVMQVMGELAGVYGLDQDQAETAGILHDAAKDLSPELIARLIHDGGIEIQYECENDYVYYLHGPVGSYFVHQQLGMTDELILDAITSHTYCGNGDNFNHPLTWCLRFADILEPNRNWSRWRWLDTGAQGHQEDGLCRPHGRKRLSADQYAAQMVFRNGHPYPPPHRATSTRNLPPN